MALCPPTELLRFKFLMQRGQKMMKRGAWQQDTAQGMRKEGKGGCRLDDCPSLV